MATRRPPLSTFFERAQRKAETDRLDKEAIRENYIRAELHALAEEARAAQVEAEALGKIARTKADREHAEKLRKDAKALQASAPGLRDVAAEEVDHDIAQRQESMRQERRKPIRQGVKASVETVPMPARLEVGQVKLLKLLAALDETTASAIIRDRVAEYLEDRLLKDKTFLAAAKDRGLV